VPIVWQWTGSFQVTDVLPLERLGIRSVKGIIGLPTVTLVTLHERGIASTLLMMAVSVARRTCFAVVGCSHFARPEFMKSGNEQLGNEQ